MQFVTVLLYIVLTITSLFLICLVLIQRGKGGGLAGAFGGSGGSSAFGSKAGDIFTRVTMITAAIWISLNMLLVVISNNRMSAYARPDRPAAKSEFTPADKSGLDKDKATKPGTSLDAPADLPPPPPSNTAKPATGAPVPEVSGGSPAAPLPLPKDGPATPPKP